MAKPHNSPAQTLDEATVARLQETRSRFTDAWERTAAGGPRPEIDTFLNALPETERELVRQTLEEVQKTFLSRAEKAGIPTAAANQAKRDSMNRASDTDPVATFALDPGGVIDAGQNMSVDTDGDLEGTVLLDPSADRAARESADHTVDFKPPEENDSARGAEVSTVNLESASDFGYEVDAPDADSPGADKTTSKTGPDRAVAGYEILGELGRGGMGVVYRARHIKLERIVALKMVLAGAHAGQDQLQRFYTEAQSVAHLQNANIVQIYEVGEQEGLPYFSLEFVDGGNLADKCGGKPQPEREAAGMVQSLARAMHHAHQHNVVHRDLKPANVLLTRDGSPKITDFGLAKRLEGESSSQTRSGAIMGTPSYMAPEQALGEVHQIGPLTDVYSLGAILYEMLTGRPPFLAATPMDTVIQVTRDEPVPPSQLRYSVPRDLETICLKCLQKEQVKRYSSAETLADDLERFLAGEPILARPVSAPERFWRWCRRNPKIATLSGAVAALLVFATLGSFGAYLRIKAEKAETERERAAAVQARDLAKENAILAQENAEAANEARKIADERAESEKAARIVADEKTEEARQAQHKADESAKLASEQGNLATNTLYNVVTTVQNKLRDQPGPGMKRLRQDLLEYAFREIEKVVSSSDSSDATLRRTRAAGYQRLGDISTELGQTETAFNQYMETARIIQAMLDEDPADEVAMYNLAAISDKLGDVSHQLENLAVANEHYRKALELRQALSAMTLKDPRLKPQAVRDGLVRSYLKKGNLSLMLGDPDGSWAAIAQYLKFQEGREFAGPREVLQQSTKIYTPGFYLMLGNLSLHLDEVEVSRAFLARSLEMGESLVKKNPDDVVQHRPAAAAAAALGDLELWLGNPAAALPFYERAHGIAQKVLEANPDTADVQRDKSMACYRLGAAHLALGNHGESAKFFGDALALREKLASDDPRNAYKQTDLIVALARCGRHAEAANRAAKLKERGASDPGHLFQVACGYALCVPAVAMGKTAEQLTPADRTVQQEYIAKSIAAVEQSLANGFSDHVALERDPDLQPVRDEAAFRELVNRLKRR